MVKIFYRLNGEELLTPSEATQRKDELYLLISKSEIDAIKLAHEKCTPSNEITTLIVEEGEKKITVDYSPNFDKELIKSFSLKYL